MLTTRWVPKSLTDEQMTTRALVCSALLKRFGSKDDFLLHLVTVDETWVHYSQCIFDFETRNKQMFTEARAFSRVTYFFIFWRVSWIFS